MSGKITAVIPVRKGSQRVPLKNVKPFGDTNLLTLKIQTLKKVKNLDKIVVSSDDDDMLKIAEDLGVDTHKRTDEFASSSCPNYLFWQNLAMDACQTEYFMLANCVAPFINVKSYETMIDEFRKGLDGVEVNGKKVHYDSLCSVDKAKDFIWDNDTKECINYKRSEAPNSQNLPNWVKLTFGVCIAKTEDVIKYKNIMGLKPNFYILNQLEAMDIDTMYDFDLCETCFKNNFDGIKELI